MKNRLLVSGDQFELTLVVVEFDASELFLQQLLAAGFVHSEPDLDQPRVFWHPDHWAPCNKSDASDHWCGHLDFKALTADALAASWTM